VIKCKFEDKGAYYSIVCYWVWLVTDCVSGLGTYQLGQKVNCQGHSMQ